MSCLYCNQRPKDDKFFNSDCVLFALENIKQHYLSLKDVISAKETELNKLQQRNEKLSKAVELLQQDHLRSSLSRISQESPPRRECGLAKSGDSGKSQKNNAADVSPIKGDLTTDDLNMALNSEHIFSCSSADTSSHLSPHHNESISETEKVHSPRVFRTSFEKRVAMFKKQRSPSPFKSPLKSNENIVPSVKGLAGAVKKANTCWMSKEKYETNNSFANVKKAASFAKPQAINICKVERKPNLSLRKPPKLKQTRLQLDVSRDKSFSGSDSTFCEDVIDASPNPSAIRKQEKPSRSWLLRVNSSVKDTNNKADKCDNGDAQQITLDEEDFGNVFDFSLKPSTPQQNKSSNSLIERDNLKQPKGSEKLVDSMDIKENDSSSVMILTPATQDIIFLDDTCDDDTHIESMDLLKELLKSNDESLDSLKRIEEEKIKKLQKTAIAAPKLETNNVASKQKIQLNVGSTKKDSSQAQTSSAKQIETKVKQEKISQNPRSFESTTKLHATKRKSKDISSDEEEEDENLIPQPFIVKQEQIDDAKVKKEPEIKSNMLSIKEKFNIDCKDCEQYISFLGDRMTDKEIMEHIQRCSRHQRKDDMNLTPEGFWNPFIQTFDMNDPRNETLIDTRFCNKKK